MRLPTAIAWLNFIVPLVAVWGAYGIALHQDLAVACVPFWEGCTSISRAARNGDALFWFRGFMMPLSMLLVIYWVYQYRWLEQLAGPRKRHGVILVLGIISALTLVLYANYLGSQGDFYRFMRNIGVRFYFGFALVAQIMSLQSLHSVRAQLSSKIIAGLNGQWLCVAVQVLPGLFMLWMDATQPAYKYEGQNIVEWNFALAMVTFHGLSAWLWKLHPPRLESPR